MPQQATIRRRVRAGELDTAECREAIAQAAGILRGGGTVAFPTETVYGLGANALDAASVAKIFVAKQRPSWDPLIVHVTDRYMLAGVVSDIPEGAQRLIDAFWPGPLTLLLPRHSAIPLEVTAGRELVGVRMPAHPVAQALIAACGLPIAAPSANTFGHISPTTAQHVLDDLDGRIDMVLDGGETKHGLESTVLEVRETGGIIYRPGAISIETLQKLLGTVELYSPATGTKAKPEALPSPGVGIRHYAPRARLLLVDTASLQDSERQQMWLHTVAEAMDETPGQRCGVMLPKNWQLPDGFSGQRFDWGSWEDSDELAHRLYAGLRALDDVGATVILCPLPTTAGMGAAIADRLQKAARNP